MRFQTLLGIGATLCFLGIYMVLPDWPATYTYTDIIPAGNYARSTEVIVYTQGQVAGDFSETSGQLISFYVFDSQQHTAYQTQQGIPEALFSVAEVSSGNYSVSVGLPGAYYLVFAHGVGLGQIPQEINFTITIGGTNTLTLGTGVGAIAAGTASLVAGYNARRKAHLQPWPGTA